MAFSNWLNIFTQLQAQDRIIKLNGSFHNDWCYMETLFKQVEYLPRICVYSICDILVLKWLAQENETSRADQLLDYEHESVLVLQVIDSIAEVQKHDGLSDLLSSEDKMIKLQKYFKFMQIIAFNPQNLTVLQEQGALYTIADIWTQFIT